MPKMKKVLNFGVNKGIYLQRRVDMECTLEYVQGVQYFWNATPAN